MLTSLAAGLVTGLGLIVAIGAQNAFVLRQGLLRSHVAAVVAVCALSDIVLILTGVSGVGVLLERADWLIPVAKWLGAAFLVWLAIAAFRAALRPGALDATADGGPPRGTRKKAVSEAFALTWLNPHVYLDTVLLLGSVAATHGTGGRWWFAAGACAGSLVWFSILGFGARRAAPLVTRPWTWRAIDILTGVTMLVVAVMLVV